MAGFLFNMGADRDSGTTREQAFIACVETGAYWTRGILPSERGRWSKEDLSVLGDFLCMREGDHVYFLCGRRIYGTGRLKSLAPVGCAIANYPKACDPSIADYESVRERILINVGPRPVDDRFVCTFEPSPTFFRNGVDMDVALSSRPESMRRLPSNQDRTFIHLDDEEDLVLGQLLLLANTTDGCISAEGGPLGADVDSYAATHARIARMLTEADYALDTSAMARAHRNGRQLEPEMALEVVLIDRLRCEGSDARGIFGCLEFLAHQVPASPTKRFRWMDKIDIFGYAYAPPSDLGGIRAPVVRYVVIEVKPTKARPADVSQVMSYVDWVTERWAGRNPSLVHAYLVAASFPEEATQAAATNGVRYYTVGRREESETRVWRQLRLVDYSCEATTGRVRFGQTSET